MVHGRNDSGEVGRSTREDLCGVFQELHEPLNDVGEVEEQCERSAELLCVRNNLCLTFRVSRSSIAIPHSAAVSSKSRKSLSTSEVSAVIAFRWLTAKVSMSNVEFHRVDTSRGIILITISCSSRIAFHAGNKAVVEWITLKASFLS